MCWLREFIYLNSFLFCHAKPWSKLAYGPVFCVWLSSRSCFLFAVRCRGNKSWEVYSPCTIVLSLWLLHRSNVIPEEVLSPPANVRSSQRFLASLQGGLLSLLLCDMSERDVLQLNLAKFIFLNVCHTAVIWNQDQISLVFNLSCISRKAGVPGVCFWRFEDPLFLFFLPRWQQAKQLGWDLSWLLMYPQLIGSTLAFWILIQLSPVP